MLRLHGTRDDRNIFKLLATENHENVYFSIFSVPTLALFSCKTASALDSRYFFSPTAFVYFALPLHLKIKIILFFNQLKKHPILKRSFSLKNTEIPFILFSSGFLRSCQPWRVWRSGLHKNKTEKFYRSRNRRRVRCSAVFVCERFFSSAYSVISVT